MPYLEKSMNFRIKEEFLEKIDEICMKFPEKFENPAHFCRIAVIKLLKEHRNLDQKDLEV